MKASTPPRPKASGVQLEEEDSLGLQEDILTFVMQSISIGLCQNKIKRFMPLPVIVLMHSPALPKTYQNLRFEGPGAMIFGPALTMHLPQQYGADCCNQHWNLQAHDLQDILPFEVLIFKYSYPHVQVRMKVAVKACMTSSNQASWGEAIFAI